MFASKRFEKDQLKFNDYQCEVNKLVVDSLEKLCSELDELKQEIKELKERIKGYEKDLVKE